MKNLFFIFLFFVFGCTSIPKKETRQIERSFYYWKTSFQLSHYEKQLLIDLQIKNLYVKFFDVAWDKAATNQAYPVAQLYFRDSGYLSKSTFNIVPTIFITNESIDKTDSTALPTLAKNIAQLTKQIIKNNNLKNISEIQIDCDWTRATASKYFYLLQLLQQLQPTIQLSATIRLHQVKFANKTGVPPVKKGMLMCYNMGNLTDVNTNNSIIDLPTQQSYMATLKNYPLPLDVALPIFEWLVLFRNGKYYGLLQQFDFAKLNGTIAEKNTNSYTILKDTIISNYIFKKGDVLRYEESTYKTILASVKLIATKLANKNCAISLYHLDTLTLKKFTAHELENIYNSMY